MEETMTIYEKLAEARTRLNVKKSGRNNFAKYGYFELADFLPEINLLAKELGFVCLVSFDAEKATMTIKDATGEGEIIFTSPMSTAELKGCHAVQNLGAVQTYLRRYLYQTAFEIVEAEQLDALPLDRQEAKQQVRAEEKKKIDDDEYLKLKIALVEYIEAGFFEHPENVERVIREKNIVQMKKALETAKEKESENNK
jgi:hypothetical protein